MKENANSKNNARSIKEKKEELKAFYTKQFAKQLRKLMDNSKYTEKRLYNQMYEDLGMSNVAFRNYTTDRLPKQIETIFLIKEYFDVPFSYLFGEINSLDGSNADVSTKYGLDESSLEVLKKLTKDAQNKDIKKANFANMKLHVINSLIQDNKLIELLATTLCTLEKEENIKNSDEIDLLKYRAIKEFISFMDIEIKKYLLYIPRQCKYKAKFNFEIKD